MVSQRHYYKISKLSGEAQLVIFHKAGKCFKKSLLLSSSYARFQVKLYLPGQFLKIACSGSVVIIH